MVIMIHGQKQYWSMKVNRKNNKLADAIMSYVAL